MRGPEHTLTLLAHVGAERAHRQADLTEAATAIQ